MKKRKWTNIASIYIGTVIGAGFASGQEIIQFFAIYGYRGIFGILLATVLFSGFGAITLSLVYNNKIKSYDELIVLMLGKKLGRLIEIIVVLFLFIGFCVMLAGSGAIFNQQLNISYNIGIYIMALFTLLTFMFNIKGISFVNSILVPFLVIGIIIVGVMVIIKEGFVFSNFQGVELSKTGNWISSSLLYVSYNSISAVVIMSSLLSIIPNRKAAIKGGIFGGVGLGIMAVFIIIPSLILYSDIYSIEIPMVKVAQYLGLWGERYYGIILWCAMFTTAIASGFGCISRISSFLKYNQRFIAIIFCTITIPFAKLGFSNLVSMFYPLFGYIGAFILLFITMSSLIHKLKAICKCKQKDFL